METKTFLQVTLGDEGFYCIAGFPATRDGTDRGPTQKFFQTIDEALATAVAMDANGLEVYFALATFKDGRSRRNDNVHQLRSFFLDLDCGPGKPYTDAKEAMAALVQFCVTVGLDRPRLVNSGGGIHAYWTLTKPVTRDEWLPVAENLKQLCRKHNLAADPAVTADSARILRVPGTNNRKLAEDRKVYILAHNPEPVDFDSFRSKVGEAPTVPAHNKFRPRGPDAVMDALAGNYSSRFGLILNKSVAGKGCTQLLHIVVHQKDISEPLWRAGLSIAKNCSDAEKSIHNLSNRHPDYDSDATERKAAAIRGPYHCKTFEEYRPEGCEGCPHKGKITSPIQLGREVLEAGPEDNVVELFDVPDEVDETDEDAPSAAKIQHYIIPKYPHPYFRGKSGGVYRRVVDKDGDADETLIYHNDVYVVRRLTIPTVGDAVVIRAHLPRDGVREFTIPMSAVVSAEELRRQLAMNGVTALKVEPLMAYITTWVNELQHRASADEARIQFGWTKDDGGTFVVGEREITPTGIDLNPPSTTTAGLFPAFKPKGTLDGWKRTAEFYNRPGFESHQFVVAKAFGSVLMQFLPINGTIMHVHSKESGLGKTTAMYVGASVWGNPDVLVLQERDTLNAKMNRAEVYKNLPLYVDEMTNTAPKDLSDFAYQIPSGQQRSRLSTRGNVERHRGAPWKLLCVTTGNTSMIERIGSYKTLPKAEAQRILEYRTVRATGLTKAETDAFSAAIRENYGHAGPVFIQHIMHQMPEVLRILNGMQRKFDNEAKLTAENRFWSVDVAATLTGLYFAKQSGLIGWELGPVFKWAVEMVGRASVMVESMDASAESMLTDYLAENYNNTLRIKSTDDMRGVNTGLDHLVHPEAVPRGALIARYEYDLKKLYLLPKPLRDWCAKQQINFSAFLDNLRTGRTRARMERIRLGKGTYVNMPATNVIAVECGEFLDDFADPVQSAGADPVGPDTEKPAPQTEALQA